MDNKKRFSLRSFTSFALVYSTIIMSWSGFILYVAPPGRIANWTDWELMLFSKAEWQALHTIFSYMFFILFVIHLFFVNWKTFLNYLKSKIRSGLNRKLELITATLVSSLFFIGTLKSWSPFGPVMAFGEKVKQSWDKRYESPPVAHMEEYTLEKLAASFPGVTRDEMIKTLNDSSIKVKNKDYTLMSIALDNAVTPSRIYSILQSRFSKQQVRDTSAAPSGVGRMTIKAVADYMGKDVSELLRILGENGIEAKQETTMKTIADQLGISPHDVYSSLAGKK